MIKRTESSPPGLRVVEAGGLVYMSGATALDRTGGMCDQIRQKLKRLDGFLADAELTKSDVIFATVYVMQMNMKSEMNLAWAEYFPLDILPGRATVGVADLGEDCLIEVQFMAARP